MESKNYVLKQTAVLALGQAVCVAAMVGIFALLGQFDYTVVLGGIMGGVVATLNFLFMAIGISLAADKATEQNVKGGKSLVTGSYMLRLILMFVVLFACAKSGHFHVIALVAPLVLVRPILTVAEFFTKKGSDV